MFIKYNLSFILRILSFIFFFYSPWLFFPTLLPFYILPIISILIIIFSLFFEKLHMKIIFSIFFFILLLLILLFLISFALLIFRSSTTDTVFLHFTLSKAIIFSVCFYSFISTLFYIRFEKWKTFEPLFMLFLMCILFWSQNNYSMTIFSHPTKASYFIFIFICLQFLQLLATSNKPFQAVLSIILFLPICIVCIFFILRIYNTLSVSNIGGLIQPTLFKFDFSPYLSLQNEIKTSDKLVLIVHTEQKNTNNFLRRLYLPEWDTNKGGFVEEKVPDEFPQLKEVPQKHTETQHFDFLLREPVKQEYFIINFDSSSLIAMDYPISITPYTIWNSISFNNAYSVISHSTNFIPFELFESPPPSGKKEEGLTEKGLLFYTKFDYINMPDIQSLAQNITNNIPGYYDKIMALTSYLHDGDFRYSLKPGTAPDGNQLSYFLFDTKKGYCTYFAFSLCLMLKSIGIPARIAAGFFIQTELGALDYYPIRANMAHAWVEVFFPYYGWISFDPTTNKVADGETLLLSNDAGGDDFFQLLNEIIEKRNLLTSQNNNVINTSFSNTILFYLKTFISSTKKFIFFIILFILLLLLFIKYVYQLYVINFSKNYRKIILLLSKKMYRLLKSKKIVKRLTQSRYDFIASIPDSTKIPKKIIEDLFELEQKARFAPYCTQDDSKRASVLLTLIKPFFKKNFLFLFIISCLCFSLTTINSEDIQPSLATDGNILLSQAQSAITAENWDTAITILSKGIQLDPLNPIYHFTLGDLYLSQKLYSSAYLEFISAKNLHYSESIIYLRLSDTASALNYDEEALQYLRQYLSFVPDDLYAWSNFGWLCYKTHRFEEGIINLQKIVENYGPDSNIFVGLGNLYASSFNYSEAKKYYSLAIQIAEDKNYPYLASIYYYNRSILEEIFYNFDNASEDTKKSLIASKRSSGYLMQGELELRRVNLEAALSNYLIAYSLDSTPLASLGLADTLIQAGYPDNAVQYLKSLQTNTDYSWIANYGTTVNQFKADFYNIQASLFLNLLNREKIKVIHNLSTFLYKYININKYRLYHWFYDSSYRIQMKLVALTYKKDANPENIYTGLNLYRNSFSYLAFNKWHNIASTYLSVAKKIENHFIPAAQPSYQYEQAHLLKNVVLYDDAIKNLNTVWERQYIIQALAERILLTKKTEQRIKYQYLLHLFSLNPASLLRYNIRLPVVVIDNDKHAIYIKQTKKLKYLLFNAGFINDVNAPFIIQINYTDTNIQLILKNITNKDTIYTQDIPKTNFSTQMLSGSINEFSKKIFQYNLGI